MARASAAAKTAESGAKTLKELRNSDNTLYARNNTPFKITCHEKQPLVDFELEPGGQPDSIKIMPKEALGVPGLQRLWMRNSITISDDESLENEILLQLGGHLEFVQAKQDEIAGLVEPSAESKDLAQATCLISGAPVFMTQKELDAGVPPLAEHLKDKAWMFTPLQKVDDKGNTYWAFNRVHVGNEG